MFRCSLGRFNVLIVLILVFFDFWVFGVDLIRPSGSLFFWGTLRGMK